MVIMSFELVQGDCLEAMKKMSSNSVHSIVTDPPYGLSFMGKKWDYDVPSVEIWKEAFRVLKPGGHLLSFAGSRTYHRMAVNIEDAGFEIRDQIMWVYGSGFPKSHNISKAIDKAAGAKREVIGVVPSRSPTSQATNWGNKGVDKWHEEKKGTHDMEITKPTTPEAQQWEGWGSALKPAHEPIVVARKPLIGTIIENVLEHGTGGLNIDGCRVETDEKLVSGGNLVSHSADERIGQALGMFQQGTENTFVQNPKGRYPANFIHDGSDEVVSLFPESARFFYCAKASKQERNAGCENLPLVKYAPSNQAKAELKRGNEDFNAWKGKEQDKRNNNNHIGSNQNHHPTVKPVALMKYLCRLVTPPNGIVLDPFLGSGTTGIAATSLDFNFIGIELSEEYMEIARHRIKNHVDVIETVLIEEEKQKSLFDNW
jgi:DNA modification methylase